MKNRGKKGKSWSCFRPHTLEEADDVEPRSIDSPVYIAVKPQSPEKTFTEEEMVLTKNKSSRSHRRALAGIFKAVLFETVLFKSRKVQQDPYHTLKNLQELRSGNNKPSKQDDVTTLKNPSKNRKTTQQHQPVKKPSKEDDKRNSKLPAATTASSSLCSPTTCESNRSFEHKVFEDSKQSKTKKIPKNRSNSSMNGLLLLLISLFMLVFWGRVCAIICTSTWIYFGPSFRQNKEQEEVEAEITRKAEEVQEMGSRQYKKKVIMEGLLERTHSRV